MKDIEEVKRDGAVISLITTIDELEKIASDIVIDNNTEEMRALDFAERNKLLLKEIEDKRKYYVGPANDYVKNINYMFRPFKE